MISQQTAFDQKEDIDEAKFLQNYVWQEAMSKCEEQEGEIQFEDLLNKLIIPSELYTQSMTKVTQKVEIIPKRDLTDVFINQYNAELLSLWKTNMDIQLVQNAHSAVMYMFSYMMKKEKGMGELLKCVAEEIEQNSSCIKEKLQKVGNAFMGAREFSAQEATMRVLSMPLVHKSKKVIFVSGYPKDERVKMPHWDMQNLDDEEEDIFQKSIHDIYSLRPKEVENITLADFATSFQKSTKQVEEAVNEEDYRLSNEEIEKTFEEIPKIIQIKLGPESVSFYHKRKFPAILDTFSFRKDKEPKKYYFSCLLLFHPWRDENFGS